MLDDVVADKPGAAYDQACPLLDLGFRVRLAHSSPKGNLESLNSAFIEGRCGPAFTIIDLLKSVKAVPLR
jgi:hypothetical protein